MHIMEEIDQTLLADGWIRSYNALNHDADILYQKEIYGYAEAGMISDGTRVVYLSMSSTGRWFSRLDGWGKVEKDIDLRDFWGLHPDGSRWNNSRGAIIAVAGFKALGEASPSSKTATS